MKYPQEYVDFIVYFHGVRDYFECHEFLEHLWKKDKPGSRKKYWSGLINIAVAAYHHRRGNQTGAARSMEKALTKLEDEKKELEQLGLNHQRLIKLLQQQLIKIKNDQPYESFNLPVIDRELIRIAEQLCMEKGCKFGNPSDLSDQAIINKHEMPNRDAIISKREEKKRGTGNHSSS